MDDIRKVGTIFGEITEILEHPDLQRPQELEQPLQGNDILLEKVSFAYEEDKDVLHDISLIIKSGTVNALVGPSGSGKSTLAKLIASFWDVRIGSISFGIDLVAGNTRVPRPAAGITAFLIFIIKLA